MRLNLNHKSDNSWRIILFGLLCLSANNVIFAFEQTNILPCDFADSVNITNGILQPNNSYIHNRVEYVQGHYAKINYTIYNNTIVPQRPYIRGCLCNVKECIRLCCPYGSYLEIKNNAGICRHHEAARNLDGEIIDQNKQTQRIKFHEHFAILHKYPCENIYISGEQYAITHKGDAVVQNQTLNQREYCLMASLNGQTKSINLNLAVCTDSNGGEFEVIETDLDSKRFILAICMLLSVLFIVATLIVVICIPKIRNLNEKCLMCYLVVLASAFAITSITQLTDSSFVVETTFCFFIPYTMHFLLLSIFFWLNVINFDLWLSFQSANNFKKLSEHSQFFWYLMYGYGVPGFLTFIVYIADKIKSIPKYLRPNFDVSYCSIFDGWFQEMIFFYLPAAIVSIINIVLFILILIRIRHVQHETQRMEQGTLQESNSKIQKVLNKKKKKCLLYLRLFIVTGISWIMEVIMIISPNHDIFFYTDLFNSFQGIYIFIIFVMNRRVLRLAKERWNAIRGRPNTNEHDDLTSNSNKSDDYLRLNAPTSTN